MQKHLLVIYPTVIRRSGSCPTLSPMIIDDPNNGSNVGSPFFLCERGTKGKVKWVGRPHATLSVDSFFSLWLEISSRWGTEGGAARVPGPLSVRGLYIGWAASRSHVTYDQRCSLKLLLRGIPCVLHTPHVLPLHITRCSFTTSSGLSTTEV